jgi:hypothetical protein
MYTVGARTRTRIRKDVGLDEVMSKLRRHRCIKLGKNCTYLSFLN